MKKRGRGVSGAVYPTSSMAGGISGVYVQVRSDGSVNLSTGCTELGQGSNTALAQILAEELGISIDDITVISGDTETTPFDVGAIASRQTHIGGLAVISATKEIKKILKETVGEMLEVDPEELEFKDGTVRVAKSPDRAIPFAKACSVTYWDRRIPLVAEGWHVPNISRGIDPITGRGEPFAAYEYQALVAEVEVDTETGLVEVLNLYVAVECGRVINTLLAEAQTEGGMMQGIGYGLRENLNPYYPEVEGVSPDYNPYQQATNLADFLIGTSEDVPHLKEAFVDYPDPVGPYGAVGISEFALNAVAPAIGNAIYDAVGVRIYSLPCTPERVLAALKAKEKEAA
jgi:CO/xanthine dehydrogenase Mo-binding subunit